MKKVFWVMMFGIMAISTPQLMADEWYTVYATDFSSDPGWTTDDPAKLGWDAGTGTFHGIQVNTEGTYAIKQITGLDFSKAWRFTYDSMINSDDWSAGLTIGFFDSRLLYPYGHMVDMSIADGGYYTSITSSPAQVSANSPAWSTGTWYHTVVEYNPIAQQLTVTVTNRSTGALFQSLTTSGAIFSGDTSYFGVSRVCVKGNAPGTWGGATVDYNLDNVVVQQKQMAYLGTYFVDDGNIITARNLSDSSVNWTHIADADIDDMVVIDDTLTHKSLLLFRSGGMTHTLDAVTGQKLWSKTGYIEYASRDAQNRLYTQPARFPNGIPTHGGSLNPVVTVSIFSDAHSDVSLVDALTGQTHWTHSVNFKRYGFGYLPLTSGSYDILCGGGPHFTGGGGPYYARLDGATGQTEVWTRQFANRTGIAIPDITGDGIYDVFASPSSWSTDLQVINGATGATIYSTNYGGGDIIGQPILLPSSSGLGCDVITSGQGGPMRRYHVDNSALSVVWQNAESNNCLLGTIERADGGLTILTHRRHQQQVAGVDAATGQVIWSGVPAWAGDNGATMGIPDVTGDGSQDVLSMSGGYCRLYDGMTGVEQTWFTPVAANNGFVAYSAMPPIAVVSPNGGEHVVAGTEYSILWSAADSITDVHLEYSTNNGQVWKNIATVPNTGSYVWQVPVKHSDQCLIRISVLGHPDDMVDTSDAVFTIFVCYPVAGDLNGDCYVDLEDFAILAGNWLACGNLYDPACFSEQQRSMMLTQIQETE